MKWLRILGTYFKLEIPGEDLASMTFTCSDTYTATQLYTLIFTFDIQPMKPECVWFLGIIKDIGHPTCSMLNDLHPCCLYIKSKISSGNAHFICNID